MPFGEVFLIHFWPSFLISLFQSLNMYSLPRGPSEHVKFKIVSACRAALLGKGSSALLNTVCFKHFIHNLGTILQAQHVNESKAISSETQLKYSPVMQSLLLIAYVFRLDVVAETENNEDKNEWKWLLNYVQSVQALKALAFRTPRDSLVLQNIVQRCMRVSGERQDPTFPTSAPPARTSTTSSASSSRPSSRDGVTSLSSSSTTVSNSPRPVSASSASEIVEPSSQWSLRADVELMQWATECASDWQVGGKCNAYLFGTGRNGQLADAGIKSKYI